MNKIFKRSYHPGYGNYNLKKICLPLCPSNQIIKYDKPVLGNKIQEIQFKKNILSYKTDDINHYSHKIGDLFKNKVFLPTSHNTPIITALQSCRNIDSSKFINYLNNLNITNKVIDDNGVFINNDKNKTKLLKILNLCTTFQEKKIIDSAIQGIFSNYGDSIYIANDYLQVSNKHVIISNYPDTISQREIERCRIVAYSLLLGNYPILLDNHINFEGEANIKFIPAQIVNKITNEYYQLCISYSSSRSDLRCIDNINKYLDKLSLPLLYNINIEPKLHLKEYFYHLDCILNFSVDSELQFFNSIDDFWNNYKKNGTLIYEKNSIKAKYLNTLNRLFGHKINVSKNDDLLSPNMIVSPKYIVGSSNITNKHEIPNFYHFIHPSYGGGGAHKCCSNIISVNKSISIDKWLDFCKKLDINVNTNFINGVKSEINRLENFFI
tara:strand:+ start:1871 stop:3184 length:1314 start_codon:yes stop_codon:yes gene_type:complete